MTDDLERRFWLSLREPGCVPQRKGPWPLEQTAKVLREFIAARPTAYIDYITLDCFGHPQIEHGPEVLQMTDGRSMSVGSKHNARVRQAADEIARLRAENEAFRKERETLAQNRRVNDAIQTALEKGELHISSDGWLARQALQEGSRHE